MTHFMLELSLRALLLLNVGLLLVNLYLWTVTWRTTQLQRRLTQKPV